MEVTPYRVVYLPKVTTRDIPALAAPVRDTIRRAIEQRLTAAPLQYGKPLQHSLHGQRRLRVGDYRVIYQVDNKHRIVTVTAIGHRKNIYH